MTDTVVEYPNRLHLSDNDPVLITRRECLQMLHIDYCERKRQKWDIITDLDQLEQYYKFMKENHLKLVAEKSMTLIPGIKDSSSCGSLVSTIETFQENTMLMTILESPNIILAGGAVVNPFYPNDYDLFFTGLETKEQIMDCLCETFSKIEKKFPSANIVIQRSIHVVNLIYVNDDYYRPIKFQFILRLYPTASHVIGGFDIPICGRYFDGKTIGMTRMAAWQYKHLTIIVDVTRQSPSFKYRLNKYLSKGLNILLVGCDCPTKTFPPERKYALQEILSLNKTFDEELGRSAPSFKRSMEIADKYGLQLSYNWIMDNDCNSWRNYHTWSSLIAAQGDLYKEIPTHTGVLQKPGQFGFKAGPFKIIQASTYASEFKHVVKTEYRGYTMGTNYTKRDYVDARQTTVKYLNKFSLRMGNYKNVMSQIRISYDIIDAFKHDLLYPNIPYIGRKYRRYIATLKKARQHLTGLKPIINNPGSQWTSSTQPDEETGINFYQGDWNGCAYPLSRDITTTLVLAWKSGNTIFSTLPKDVFKLILWYDFMQICV